MKIKDIHQAVILAGGLGKRLRPITYSIPKPMVLVNQLPFLDYLIKSIIDLKIKNILILTGYKSKIISNRYKNMKLIDVSFSKSNINDLSGRRLLNAYDKLEDHFLLMYGDNYWPINLEKMIKSFNKNKSLISLTGYLNKKGKGEYGYKNNVKINNKGLVTEYNHLRKKTSMDCVNIGYFIIDKKILNKSIKKNLSFEEDIMKAAIIEKKVSAYLTNRLYQYITNYSSLKICEAYMSKNKIRSLSKKYFSK